jgi:hypothetical protein
LGAANRAPGSRATAGPLGSGALGARSGAKAVLVHGSAAGGTDGRGGVRQARPAGAEACSVWPLCVETGRGRRLYTVARGQTVQRTSSGSLLHPREKGPEGGEYEVNSDRGCS